jgi:hypothetical protein
MEEAVREILKTQVRSDWLASTQEALERSRNDLFRQSQIGEAVRECGALAVTPLEREVAECMRAQIAFHHGSHSVLPAAMREVARRLEERSHEQLASSVGGNDGKQLRRILAQARGLCHAEELIEPTGAVSAASRLKKTPISLDEEVSK